MERPKNISDEQWVIAQQIYESAKRQGDKYPELTVAQAALETGWFKKPSGKYNFFGQKASSKQAGTFMKTKEVANNQYYSTSQKFRDYNSIDEAVSDRIKKWSSKYNDADNIDEALGRIWRYDENKGTGVGYATDIKYGSKVKSVLNQLGIKVPQTNYSAEKQEAQPDNFTIEGNSGSLLTAGEYKEPKEVQQAKQELVQAQNEENFLNDLSKLFSTQQQVAEEQYQPNYLQQSELFQIQPVQGIQYQEQQPFMYAQDGGYFFQKGNSTYVKKDRLEPSTKDIITKLPGTGIQLDSEGNVVYKSKDGTFKSIPEKNKTEVRQRKESPQTKYYEAKAKKEEEEKKTAETLLKSADVVTDVMQLGNFVPHPAGQAIGKWGNSLGALVDGYQAYKAIENEDYLDAGINTGSMLLPSYLGSNTFRRTSKWSTTAPYFNEVLGDKGRTTYINLRNQVRKQTPEQLTYNRALLGTLGAETIYDLQGEPEYQDGGIIKDDNGYLNPNNWGKTVEINSPYITMEGVNQPLIGISKQTGEQKIMQPGKKYFFKDTNQVIEIPIKNA